MTYPQAVAEREKRPESRLNIRGDGLTTKQVELRRALARGDFKTHDGMQRVFAEQLRFIPDSRNYVIGLVQQAYRNGDPDATAWWDIFVDLVPADRDRVDLGAVCEASGVTPDRLMAVVVSTGMRLKADLAELIASSALPEIIGKTTESAMRITGKHAGIAQKDREFLLQHHKFIPVARGGSVFVSNTANAQAAAAAAQNQPSVPTFRESLQGAGDAYKAVQGELVGEAEE